MANFPVPTLLVILLLSLIISARAQLPGTWETVTENAGIASMHTAVTHRNTVVLLDRTDIGPTKKLLGNRHCRRDSRDSVLKIDCYAHSAELDLATAEIRPLTILTDTWCSSGQFLPNGTLIQTGGGLDGIRKIRLFRPFDDWSELAGEELAEPRWYSTNQILPDGTVIIVGGRGSNSVEFFPPKEARPFLFLAEAEDVQMDNLYPFVHLLPNGHLFVFANNRAVMFDYESGEILRRYPSLEGGPRNYPSGGSSAMLALSGDFSEAEVVVCGGAEYGAFLRKNSVAVASGVCGRISAMLAEPTWRTEEMPFGRIMGDMVALPTGDVLIINGAQRGSQGFELGSDPVLYPLLYRPTEPVGLRFMTLSPGTVPRLYHSTANLLPDGRVLLAGSNPHMYYKFEGVEFPTELRIEAFSPEYLAPGLASLKPTIIEAPERMRYGEAFEVVVSVPLPVVGILEVNLASAPFATHSFSQGQRVVKLAVSNAMPVEGPETWRYKVSCNAPSHGAIAPPGYYMAFVVNQGVPSVARWIQIGVS